VNADERIVCLYGAICIHVNNLKKENKMELSKKLYQIPEVIGMLSIGRTSVYNAISAGTLTAKKFGSKTLITAESIESFLETLPEKDGGKND
jgi:predicted DNA-binding transcriptional regulator AlpA